MSEPLPLPICALVEEWLAWCVWTADPGNKESTDSPVGHFEFAWTVEHHPARAWEAIMKVTEDPRAKTFLGLLAAGPLEDLLALHGDEYIDQVEAAAYENPTFARMLLGVAKFTMSDAIWERVQRIQRQLAQ